MKTIAVLLNNPMMVCLSSIFGSTAMFYLKETAVQSLYWFIPCLAIIIADLSAGVKAAESRGETVRFSKATRRTVNKCVCYASWIVCCVALNERYGTQLWAWVGMGNVFVIEGFSFITNLLEPHGLKISMKGVLKVLGAKSNIPELDNVVEEINKKTKE